MPSLTAVPFALLAAASNALASVLQRRAARNVPAQTAFRLALFWALLRQPVWLCGIAALIAGFVLQATALSFGGLALVQPILVAELPFTMLLIACLARIRLDRRTWVAIGALTVGLAVLLAAAAPSDGTRIPSSSDWWLATVGTVGSIAALVAVSRLVIGAPRAAVLGVAAGLGFSFTATFMKESTNLAKGDLAALPTAWQPYAMVVAGLFSLFLLQNSLQSGTLVAAQPALTISDPVASIIYGALLFGEDIRSGPWAIPEAVGMGLILYGSLRLAQAPPLRERVG